MTKHAFGIRYMSRRLRRQEGAVLLLVTFSLILFFGLAALVIDVGRMYIVKSQLQNAADAGALRAAKELNGTAEGVGLALGKGVQGALQNKFLLTVNGDTNSLNENDVTVMVGPTPGGPFDTTCSSNTADTNYCGNLYFAKVTTQKSGIPSIFAGLLNIKTSMSSAVAVAGRYIVPIGPLGVCAPQVDTSVSPHICKDEYCGFKVGLTYNVDDLNPIGYASGDKIWLDPASDPACPDEKNRLIASACTGKSSITIDKDAIPNPGTKQYLYNSIDSRFGYYPGSEGTCNQDGSAPSDTNVMQYLCPDNACTKPPDTAVPSTNANWADPTNQVRESATVQNNTYNDKTFDTDGVVWSYSSPEDAPLELRSANSSYPSTGTPYSQTSGSYFAAPVASSFNSAVAGRRLMNLAILDCPQVEPTACGKKTVPILAVGKFFLPRRTGKANEIDLEFVRLVPSSELQSEIKLFR